MSRTRRISSAAALVALICTLSACGGGSGSENEVTVDLTEQTGSGQSGTATLTAVGQETRVMIELANPPEAPQPAHVHPGTCRQLDPKPAYSLANVEAGASDTTLPVALEELRNAELVINVHKSQEEIATYAACGAIG
jgi:Cu/Zn superoxide dismutase